MFKRHLTSLENDVCEQKLNYIDQFSENAKSESSNYWPNSLLYEEDHYLWKVKLGWDTTILYLENTPVNIFRIIKNAEKMSNLGELTLQRFLA